MTKARPRQGTTSPSGKRGLRRGNRKMRRSISSEVSSPRAREKTPKRANLGLPAAFGTTRLARACGQGPDAFLVRSTTRRARRVPLPSVQTLAATPVYRSYGGKLQPDRADGAAQEVCRLTRPRLRREATRRG